MGSATRHVKAAFEDRVRLQLETDYAVHYPGDSRFDPKEHEEWIEIADLGFTPEPVSGAGGKRVEAWTFQLDCYVEVGEDSDSSHRVWDIVDDIVDAFRLTKIDVNDLTQDAEPKVGELTFTLPDATPVTRATDPGATGDHISVTIPAHYDDL